MTDKVYKAYSLLTEKQFDANDTVVRGWATTPTPDRVDDVVVPEGAVFRTNDFKLHLYHDSRLPVGTVEFGKAVKKGIPFEAKLPNVKEEGVVRDRVLEAVHSLKYNLISAVSIGFRALEDGVEVLKSGGLKFTKWEMIELSLVSTPANPEAVITAVKSMQPLSQDMIRLLRASERGGIPLIKASPVRRGAVELIRR